ncbi:MAG: PKD domain-containing protein [Cyclobacteriaceae bacterium]
MMANYLLIFLAATFGWPDTITEADYPHFLSVQNCVILDLGPSVQADNKNLIYEWSFGDGLSDLGVVAEHCYDSIGLYQAVLTVTDPYSGADFENEYVVDVEIQPTVELLIDENRGLDGKFSPVARLKHEGGVSQISFYWDVEGEYIMGESPMDDIKIGTEVRVLSRFYYRDELIHLSKTVTLGGK